MSVAFERYIYVCHPTKVKRYYNMARARTVSFAVFLSMSLLAIPYAMRYRTVEVVNNRTGARSWALEVTELCRTSSSRTSTLGCRTSCAPSSRSSASSPSTSASSTVCGAVGSAAPSPGDVTASPSCSSSSSSSSWCASLQTPSCPPSSAWATTRRPTPAGHPGDHRPPAARQLRLQLRPLLHLQYHFLEELRFSFLRPMLPE